MSGSERTRSNDIIYGLGIIGSAVHFLSEAGGFWEGAFGIMKALLWPAFLIYEAFQAMGA